MLHLPKMTHALSAHWRQPPADQVAVYDDIAIMERETFDSLCEYSMSIPSGAYEGKMWRCKTAGEWLLCWYGPSKDPKMVSINQRPIRLLGEGS